ncbi:hypothetical protein M430DRAFT_34220 [Amorphotheca resinae ATCC 22711]|uniref:Response regulatory domain-containing protein n=1 Tax=Amorphotheca resinae ATCC 22711 TaxID=857342 RepID=A0A2T3B6F3_AMORE|nr:hypothetical protein M430DRAFT_34220 [Amorphotheca resinae ATCC 22711]PSS22313.1 hypothetical protein M430DRAFT_34220 [Amorphotheca resinae ATCC 22711]
MESQFDGRLQASASQAPAQNNDGQVLARLRALTLHHGNHAQYQESTVLPPSSIPQSSTDPIPTALQQDGPRSLRILLVRDNVINLKVINAFLLKHKYDRITTARNGNQAVAAVRQAADQGESFDLILMDVSMPGMDGFEATRLIRSFERGSEQGVDSREHGMLAMGKGEDDPLAGEVKEKDSSGGRGRNRAYIVALSEYGYASVRDEVERSGFDCIISRPTNLGKVRELLQRLQKEKE